MSLEKLGVEMGAFAIESLSLSALSSGGSALFLLSRSMLPLAELVIRPACLVLLRGDP